MKQWICGFLALSSLTYGAFLGSDFPEKGEDPVEPPIVRPIPRPIPRPQPIPPAPHALTRLINQIEVGTPAHYRHVTVYPLQLRGGHNSGIRTMSEAMSRGWLEIQELGQARVPVLNVRNTSAHSVFLMSGEIVLGGKQDRVIQKDVLIPPRSRWISVPVYCVEQDRWNQPVKPTFRYSGYLAGGKVRRLAAKSASQDAVWESIDTEIEQSNATAPTRSYKAVFESPAFKKECDEAVARYRKCLASQTVGAVVVAGGRVMHCDIFSDPALCAKLWPHITRSYWADGCRVRAPQPRVTKHLVGVFLRQIHQSRLNTEHTPGSGRLYNIRGALEGHALEHDRAIVHASLFPGRIQLYRR